MSPSGRMRPIQRAKRILRKEIAAILNVISDEDKRAQALLIYRKFFELSDYRTANRIGTYINSGLEVDTDPIISNIFRDKKLCFVPRYSFRKKEMNMVRLKDLNDLADIKSRKCRGVHNVKHSDVREDAVATGGLDMIIVSGLAYTRDGKRLGHGGGYYDTYLKKIYHTQFTRPITIALAFHEQIFPYLPTHLHDVHVDIVLTPD